MNNSVFDCSIVTLPIVHNVAGNITAINNSEGLLPFKINRIYYLYDIPGGESRGGHAHKKLEQLIIAASGSFDITVDDGRAKRTVHLSRPNAGFYLPSGIWREMNNFSSGAVCLVLASEHYKEDDYIREYDEFANLKTI